uniref:Uncharacterized protein n=1 Tax=Rhizophagus irregularis (strain DAOM 181602 / DAOM 197198 / MUCL 43194) TaxID=747089 RepID=U9V896_RHIID
MELEYEDHIINIKYNLSLDNIKLDAYIQLNQQPILDDDEEHQDNPIGIMVDEQEIGNGNTINLKLGGDGRNVGRKQNHVLINTIQRKIQTLAKVVKYQLQDLQENGISVNDVH